MRADPVHIIDVPGWVISMDGTQASARRFIVTSRRAPDGARRSHNRDATGEPTDYGYQTLDLWLTGIRERRAANPAKDEIQAALTYALSQGGRSVAQVAEATGIQRQQFYQGNYKIEIPGAPTPEGFEFHEDGTVEVTSPIALDDLEAAVAQLRKQNRRSKQTKKTEGGDQ